MRDAIGQEIVPGDIIWNKGKIGVVYGETPKGEVRYLYFPIQRMWNDNNPGWEDGIDVRTFRIGIPNIPVKAYTRSTDAYFKLTAEQAQSWLDTNQFADTWLRGALGDEGIEELGRRYREAFLRLEEETQQAG